MDKKKTIVTIIVSIAMLCMMPMTASAIDDTVNLPTNQAWSSSRPISRTGAYSYVTIRLKTVYPRWGDDNLTQIDTRLVNSSETVIMTPSYVTLTEGEYPTRLYIKDGYLNLNPVYIQYRNCKEGAATAIVEYVGH